MIDILANAPRYEAGYLLKEYELISPDIMLSTSTETLRDVEVHIYSRTGDYIMGNHNAGYGEHDAGTNSILVNISKVFKDANILKGSFIICINILENVLGKFNDKLLLIDEISPNRTEIRIKSDIDNTLIDEIFSKFLVKKLVNLLHLNVGHNQLYQIVNFKLDTANNGFYIKLKEPIDDAIEINDKVYISNLIIDRYIDNIILINEIAPENINIVPKPNYNLSISDIGTESTPYKSWDDILSFSTNENYSIINSILSGSAKSLNIDYTDFKNFVFYSSAEYRINNFFNKIVELESIESERVSINSDIIDSRLNDTISNFDDFEKWLYYASTGSIFTHDISGSIVPFPKYNGTIIYNSTSSLSIDWLNSTLNVAKNHDQQNDNRLWWAIPEHFLMDSGNSNFITFVELMGQFYDVIYAYITAIFDVYNRDEHPERGFSNSISYYIAKSFGWQLQNSFGSSNLLKYKTSNSNENALYWKYQTEYHTQQLWRRIINNLPFLYKTKGTRHSISALLSIFGIPDTLISIKEYGGPSTSDNVPVFIDDRYYYKLQFNGKNYIELDRLPVIYNNDKYFDSIVPDTIEFRFDTTYKDNSEYGQTLWALENYLDRQTVIAQLSVVYLKYDLGFINFRLLTEFNSQQIIRSAYTSEIPIYSGQQWNIQITNINECDVKTFDSVESALSVLGESKTFYLSIDNVYGLPYGIEMSTPGVSNDLLISSSNQIGTGSIYYLSDDNIYGLPKLITYRNSFNYQYESDQDAIENNNNLVNYSLKSTNIYGLPEGLTKLLLYDKYINIRIGMADDCGNGTIVHNNNLIIPIYANVTTQWYDANSVVIIGGITGSFQTYPSNIRFSGSLYGYKEYYEVLSESDFNAHTLNPMSYAGSTPTSSYYTLHRYYPLGLDCQRWDHSIYQNVSSSHPNQKISQLTTASFKGFEPNIPESEWYKSTTERFYIYTPSIAGDTLRSNKIRFEETKLFQNLNPYKKSDIGTYDISPSDTNRLAVVFSPTDQINNEIFNHIGYAELDNYIADPENEFNNNYPELINFANEYFKKYLKRPSVNTFIRVFSVFDFVFFDQLKQLMPAKVDYIGGVLIEDDILHRNKAALTKLPIISNPQYNFEVELFNHNCNIEYNYFTSTASFEPITDIKSKYYTSDLIIPELVDISYSYYSSSLQINLHTTAEIENYNKTGSGTVITSGDVYTEITRFSGSRTAIQPYIYKNKIRCDYKKVNYFYNNGSFSSDYLSQWHSAVSMSYGWYYSKSLEDVDYQFDEFNSENYKRFVGTRLTGLGININSPNTIDGGPVVTIKISNENSIVYKDEPFMGNLKIE